MDALRPHCDFLKPALSVHRLTWLTDEAKGVVTFSTDAAVPSGAVVYNNYGQKVRQFQLNSLCVLFFL
jgi:hypothetical protein